MQPGPDDHSATTGTRLGPLADREPRGADHNVVTILTAEHEPDSAVFDSSTAREQVGVVGTPAHDARRYVRVFEVLKCTDDTCPTT